MNSLIKCIKEKSIEYGSIPFWSWNDKLESDELIRQIHNMKDMQMRGFFMHARGGLETEYMSEEWYDRIKVCVDEAKKLGMEAWSYDENGWPSGFAGGKLLDDPENFAVYVEGKISEEFPIGGEDTLAIYAFDSDGIPHAVTAAQDGCNKYLEVTMGTDGSYVDTMRSEIIKKFIEATHEDYKARLGDDFGGAMPGFFTDEPQYYRWNTPYSRKMDSWFLEEYGYSVIEALPSLFCDYQGAEQYRYDYHRMTNKRFTEGFSKTLYDWHDANGVMLTGHFVEENTLYGQMMCCGDIMPQYLYEHIPGIDYLGRLLRPDIAPKQLSSVCAQTGRKKVLSEMFGCCGWDVTPKELKNIAELQYANGVNVMCQHLYPYSIRGQRKRDYPAFYSEHNPWQKEMVEFNRYFNNLGAALSLGEEYADVLVIHPIHSAWLKFQRIHMKECLVELDNDLKELTYLLSGNQIAYHFGSEAIMADMAHVDGDRITVGLCSYGKVVIPALDTLDSSTIELLIRFKENGGKIYTYKHHLPTMIDGRPSQISFLDDCEDITDSAVFDALKQSGEVVVELDKRVELTDVRTMVRFTEYGKLIYITNLSDKDIFEISITAKNCSRLGGLDIQTLDVYAVKGVSDGENVKVVLDLPVGESIILYENGAPEFLSIDTKKDCRYIALSGEFTPVALPDNFLALDRAHVSLNGGEFSDLLPMERIRDELFSDRFEGVLTLAFPFMVKDIPDRLEVITESMGQSAVTVNGNILPLGSNSALDVSFKVTDISKYVVEGENRIEISLDYWQREEVYEVLYGGGSETLRNSLSFDVEIENIYLRGSFALDMKKEDFTAEENNAYRYNVSKGIAIVKPRESIDITNIVTDGYPFYCGEITVRTDLKYKLGDPTVLHLTGRFATAKVSVNKTDVGVLMFGSLLDLSEYLCEGDNEIAITLCNNYRNLMGPHHFNIAEPLSIGPLTFSFEKGWNDGKCDQFNGDYAFVRFGIDK